MSPSTINNMIEALELGYRVRKSNGERILLSDAMRKNYEMALKAERAKRGRFAYISVEPVFGTEDVNGKRKVEGFKSYGPAYRFGNKYLNKAQLIQALA